MNKQLKSTESILARLGLDADVLTGGSLTVTSPVDGGVLAQIRETTDMDAVIAKIGRAHV